MNNFYEFQVFMDMNDETGEYFTSIEQYNWNVMPEERKDT